jgi:hypothetical protein
MCETRAIIIILLLSIIIIMNTKEKGILKRAMVSRYHTKSHHCNTTEIDVRNASDYYYIIIIYYYYYEYKGKGYSEKGHGK